MFQNATEAPSRTEGVNREVDVSVSRNSVGSYDGRVVTNEYSEKEYSLASIRGEMKSTDISGFVNMASPPSLDLTGRNVEASVSAHLNGHGTFDGTIHKETYQPKSYDLGSVSSGFKMTAYTAFYNMGEPLQLESGSNKDGSVSAHMNGHGTLDGLRVQEEYIPVSKTLVSHTSNASLDEDTYAYMNQVNPIFEPAGVGQRASASAHMNAHGTFDGTCVVATAKPQDTGWLTWESKQKMPTFTYKWAHGIRVFTNQEVGWVSELAGSLRGKDGSVSMSINSFGLVDGTGSYRELVEWELTDDDGSGGIETGVVTLCDERGNEIKSFNTRAYSGGGNDGMERHDKATHKIIKGVSLPARTYIID